jgi:hypothetical protein
MTKISHSARGKFDHCARMYQLHYLDKIRPVGTTSSLLFGSAIDAAAEHYLLNGDKELCKQTFKNTWKEQEINGTLTDLKSCTQIEFHANDFDHELLTESDYKLINETTVSETLPDHENQKRITLSNWVSLFRKGQILINAFIEWVDNNVDEVLEAQAVIELTDEEGNEITGKADFIIKMKGYDIPLLVDLKTAARYYERDSVKQSEQLALYYFFLTNTKYPEMKRAAYLVLSKQIRKNRVKTCKKCGTVTEGREQVCAAEKESGELITKGKNKGKPKMQRCNGEFDVQITPEATIQFIHDEIPKHFIEETIEKYGVVIDKIKVGEFNKNLDGCSNYYGRECPYKKYCENGCMDGLIKKE